MLPVELKPPRTRRTWPVTPSCKLPITLPERRPPYIRDAWSDAAYALLSLGAMALVAWSIGGLL